MVTALIVSFAIAIYQLWFYDPYVSMLEDQGKTVGIGETALGIFITLVIASVLSSVVTKNLSKSKTNQVQPRPSWSGCFPYYHAHGSEKKNG
jgi:Na+-driven multidrug efflux pump